MGVKQGSARAKPIKGYRKKVKKRKKKTDAEKKMIDPDDDGKDDKANFDKPDMNFVTSKFGETAYDILYNYI